MDYGYFLDGSVSSVLEKTSAGARVAEHRFDYDLNGNRTKDAASTMNADDHAAVVATTSTYTFDPLDRVATVTKTGAGAGTESYTHDANGNVIAQSIGGVSTSFTYNRDRLLTAVSGGSSAGYMYDPFGRLESVTSAGRQLERKVWTTLRECGKTGSPGTSRTPRWRSLQQDWPTVTRGWCKAEGMTQMVPHVVAVLGRGVVSSDEPVVTADDLGLTRGDGCFDSTRVITDAAGNAAAVDLDGHLDRLRRSASALDIAFPGKEQWRELVTAALVRWSTPGEAVLKLVLTRGREWRATGPTAYVTITHLDQAGIARPREPRTITAVTLTRGHGSDAFRDAPWLLGGVKTLSYVVNVAAQREARRRGADDVIFTTTDGYALDGPTSGLIVARGGQLLSTPTGDTGILESVSVQDVFEAARADGWTTRFVLVPVEDLYTSDGLWLVSSGRGPVLVSELDGRPLPVDAELASRVVRYAGFPTPG